MREDDFRLYLQRSKLQRRPQSDCLSRCKRVEKTYGDLDEHFAKDQLEGLLKALEDDIRIHIDGDRRTGLSSLRTAVRRYKKFCLEME